MRWWHGLLGALICLGIVMVALWPKQVIPTEQTQSAFFHDYSLDKSIATLPFWHETSGFRSGEGDIPGEKSATHSKNHESHVVINREDWMALVEFVADDLQHQLNVSGARLLGVSGDPRQGFHYQYAIGNTLGTAVIEPLDLPDPDRHGGCLNPSQISARLRVNLGEEWFEKKPGLITIRISAHAH